MLNVHNKLKIENKNPFLFLYKHKAKLLQHITMTTYKQLQDSWIRSEWVNTGAEDFGEDALVIIPAGFVSVTLDDLIKKRVMIQGEIRPPIWQSHQIQQKTFLFLL